MRRKNLVFWAVPAAIAVAGCGEEPGAGGVTAEESRQLDEAAGMLDENANRTAPAPPE